ncbi:Type-1 restriction enzyme EcoKI specificity protein [Photorhabdus australis subsp. thailandensis]|uniref:Type-1 restriction enzyme EcoKI specificity protein n=1 Tax=Photorhabdus australis subsp. thailandensis TaxID=2805096 RepID=A0A1C0U6D9_9GAMM|nr:restriction endonuclease subunit S [Photorhabdus australis]OCQ53487.1 Type-1 restriction enzyme EcoKI specificity protein [Photorhabdus australis subsp. thailandensis]
MLTTSRIGDLCEIIRGVTFTKGEGENVPFDNAIPIIRAGSIQKYLEIERDLIWISKKKVKDAQKIKRDDILMCMSSGSSELVGKTAIADSDWNGSFGAFCSLLRPKIDKCIPKYIYYVLNSPIFRKWTTSSSGSNIKNIRISELNEFLIPLPSLEEQKRIAAILDKADSIRRKREQAIKLADDFLQATFLEMFGDPVVNPNHWNKYKLKDITTKIGSGATPKGGKNVYVENGISFIRSLNVHDNKFLHKDLVFINDTQASALKNVEVKKNDILLNITGASVCRCTIVDNNILPARVNQHVSIIRSEVVNHDYLLHILISSSFKQYLLSIARSAGATREALTKDQIENLPIPIPPIELQNKFGIIKRKIENMIEKMDSANENSLIEALSDEYF